MKNEFIVIYFEYNGFSNICTHLFVNCNNIKPYTEVTTFPSVISVYSSKVLITTSVQNGKYSKEYSNQVLILQKPIVKS